MPSHFRQDLSSIDFYHALQPKEGTLCGGISSILLIIFLLTLSIASVTDFKTPQTSNDLIAKFNHVSGLIKVHIDIEFPRFPCSILSLTHFNSFEVLETSFRNIEKLTLPDMKPFVPNPTKDEDLQTIFHSIDEGKGCRMKGYFQIERIPGHFRFFYNGTFTVGQGLIEINRKIFNVSHKINELRFGDQKFTDQATKTLNEHLSEKETIEAPYGISYLYYLNIVEKSEIDEESGQKTEKYLYTTQLNEIALFSTPMVYFQYSTSSVSAIQIRSDKTWYSLFVNLVGILGGLYTTAILVYRFIYSSSKYLLNRFIIKSEQPYITIIINQDDEGKREIQMVEKNELKELQENEEKIIIPIHQKL